MHEKFLEKDSAIFLWYVSRTRVLTGLSIFIFWFPKFLKTSSYPGDIIGKLKIIDNGTVKNFIHPSVTLKIVIVIQGALLKIFLAIVLK